MARPPALTTSVAELVSSAASHRGDEIAVSCAGVSLSYRELDYAVAALADDLLDRGIKPDDPIAALCGIGVEFPVVAYAVLRAGATLIPISPASPPAEVTQLLRAARAEMVLTDLEHEELAWTAAERYDQYCGAITIDATAVRHRGDRLSLPQLAASKPPPPAPRVPAGSPAVVLFTSGSTGRPKGVVHSHEGLYRNAQCVAYDMVGLTHNDVMLGALPLAHSFGLSAVMNATLLAGGRLELMPRFDEEKAWKLIKDQGVTVVTGVPTMFRRLSASRRATRHTDLRIGIVSGSRCPVDIARDVAQWMGIPLIERYGMTEASPISWHQLRDESADGDVGRPAWGVHVRAVGPGGAQLPADRIGELEVQAPSMLLRYLGAADNDEGFHGPWLRTGDLGMVRADGGLTLTGRIKNVILRGGYTVSSREVELALESHPAVAESAVVGIPDADLGEEIGAAIVFRRTRKASVEELERHLSDRIAAWKQPRRWHVASDLPRTPLGKLRGDEIVKLFSGEAPL